jgi:hypothetical protein
MCITVLALLVVVDLLGISVLSGDILDQGRMGVKHLVGSVGDGATYLPVPYGFYLSICLHRSRVILSLLSVWSVTYLRVRNFSTALPSASELVAPYHRRRNSSLFHENTTLSSTV